MFGNECLGELAYEGTTSAIVMAGIFISFLVEFIGHRIVRAKVRSEAALTLAEKSKAMLSARVTSILVMEAGIIFHSVCALLPAPGLCHLNGTFTQALV
jgi:solute carrier family 39 (zinc transporter), member 1/2/3